jgi:hypothetical protein
MRQSQKVTLQQSNIAGWFERRNHPTQRVCVVALSSHQLMETKKNKNKKPMNSYQQLVGSQILGDAKVVDSKLIWVWINTY